MQRRRTGFTLLELLVALAVFSLAMALAGGAFWGVAKAWTRGGEMLEQLHYGEFVMEQLVTALRGAAWFPSKPSAFGFWLEHGEASWVTSGSAFLPLDSPLRNGLHRVAIGMDTAEGERGLVVRAWPHLMDDMDKRDARPMLASAQVADFDCEWYDFELDTWSHKWEETNSLPKLVRVTLKMKRRQEFKEELVLQRVVELEVAPDLPAREHRDRTTRGGTGRRDAPPGEAPAQQLPTRQPPADDRGLNRPGPAAATNLPPGRQRTAPAWRQPRDRPSVDWQIQRGPRP